MECHSCGNEYSKVVTHWTKSSECSHPKFTDYQWDVLTGVLMGDGSVDDKFDERRNPRMKIVMTNEEYLEHLYEFVFNDMCTQRPYIHRTKEEIAKRNNPNSFSNSSDPNDYKDQYKIQTISHPELNVFAEWYSSGEKVFPESIDMAPNVLKHWYVCDGSFNYNGHRFYTEIHCSNERENKDKIESYFDPLPFSVSRWRDDAQDDGTYKTSIIFNKGETKKLFNYIGESVPGFEYKWP